MWKSGHYKQDPKEDLPLLKDGTPGFLALISYHCSAETIRIHSSGGCSPRETLYL